MWVFFNVAFNPNNESEKDWRVLAYDYSLKDFLLFQQVVDVVTALETARMKDQEERDK